MTTMFHSCNVEKTVEMDSPVHRVEGGVCALASDRPGYYVESGIEGDIETIQ